MNEAAPPIGATSGKPMARTGAVTAVAEPGTVNRRSSKPQAREWPLLGELLRSARVAGGILWPDLEAVARSRGSRRGIEAGTTRTRVSRLRPSRGTGCSCGNPRPADRHRCAAADDASTTIAAVTSESDSVAA